VNFQQALETIPGLEVFDASPEGPPAGAYAVVSEIIEGTTRQLFRGVNGSPHALKELTLLATLYGPEGTEKADLRPIWQAAKAVQGKITTHPGITRLIGVRPGASLPPTYDRTERRAMAGVRFVLNYGE